MSLLFAGAAVWPDPSTGVAAANAKMYVYLAGTTTPVTTYQDVGLATAHTFPVVAAGSGVVAPVYVSDANTYRIIVTTSADVTIADMDNIVPSGVLATSLPTPEDYGAVGDGTTDDAAAINAAMTYAADNGGGIVQFGAKTYAIGSTIEIDDLVIMQGEGLRSELFLLAGSNCDMVRTRGYTGFTGTNSWIVNTTGIPWGYGIRDMKFNGNGANNTSGRGLVGYGKIRFMENVLILATAQRGIFHECGNTVGQTDFRDLPEAIWEGVQLYDCGNVGSGDHGAVFAGPHDAHYNRIVAVSSGTTSSHWNVWIYGDTNTTGGGRVGRIHTYGGDGSGVKISGSNATLQGEHVIAENGLLIAEPGSSINLAQCGSANYGKAIHMTAGGNQIGMARVGTNDEAHDAIVIESSGNIISNIRCFAESAGTGVSLDIDGGNNQIGQAYLDGQGGTGGRAIRIGNTTGVDNNTILSAYITGAEKSLEYANAGVRNEVSVISSNGTATNHFIGDAPAATDNFKIVSLGSTYDLPPIPISDYTPVGNVGTGSDTLISENIPAGSFFRTGVTAKIKAWGATANNSNTKTVTLEFGSGNTILTQTLQVSVAGVWSIEADVISTGTNTQYYVVRCIDTGGTPAVFQGTSTQTTTAAISVRCRGESVDGGGGVNDGDISQAALTIEWVM